MTDWYAKSGNRGGWWEPLANHLTNVADRASHNATSFGAGQQAYVAGLLHDLGKYSPRFRLRLEGKESGLDHWSTGAAAALKMYKWTGVPIACALLGHHLGLGSGHAKTVHAELSRLITHPPENLTEKKLTTLLSRMAEDGLKAPECVEPMNMADEDVSSMLDIRMLFSALVDADAYWSEAHRNGDAEVHYRPRLDGPKLDAKAALALLLQHMEQVRAGSSAASHVNLIRDRLFQSCLDAGSLPRGLFTLAAPTGAGKTWAMLAFALRQAVEHRDLRRIIVVIPYLSIIEQTARQYRSLFAPVFGERFLIEDHSMAGVSRETSDTGRVEDEQAESRQIARLLAENWDAPLVITTSVQCLESLFANRPAACRKLHNVIRSVILFDEVQTLPINLAVPTLAGLSRLVGRYGCSVVFATATQPAFDHLDSAVKKGCASGWKPREISFDADLFGAIRARPRTEVQWRLDTPTSWGHLAEELTESENDQVLCIVNLKRHAHDLSELLRQRFAEGVMHLSTNMCPAHRESVLTEVKRRLDPHVKQPCRLISTQCVEAGVDVDFPAVYRALAPLEAVAQAAGRCNRGGSRLLPGRLVVFVPEDERYPPGGYAQAAGATKSFLAGLRREERDCVLDSPDLLRRYYVDLYSLTKAERPDTEEAARLRDALDARDFVRTAEFYRLIKTDTINVLVPYDKSAFDSLVAQYENDGRLTSQWLMDARPHTVAVFRLKPDGPGWTCLRPLSFSSREEADSLVAEWFCLDEHGEAGSLYDADLFGLKALQDRWIA